MDTLEAIRRRRAVKHFDPEYRLTDDQVEQLMSLAMLAPTAFNIQHWRFLVVRDRELRAKIRAVSWDQAQLTDGHQSCSMVAWPRLHPCSARALLSASSRRANSPTS